MNRDSMELRGFGGGYCIYIAGVTGSSPVPPTILMNALAQ